MNFLERALPLAKKFKVLPLRPGTKIPAIENFTNEASSDPEKLKYWNSIFPDANVGISTQFLLVVDVDVKNGKNGFETIERLKSEGKIIPKTLTQRTPTGGAHYVFKVKHPVRQGTNVLGPGLDIRGAGGQIAAAGSRVESGTYTIEWDEIAEAPEWLIEKCGAAKERDKSRRGKVIEGVDPDRARQRAELRLSLAEGAVEGQGGNQYTYKLACGLKDDGVDEATCFELMSGEWNGRCVPPWSLEELEKIVGNAYGYGAEPIGANAPEAQFTPIFQTEPKVLTPVEKLNREYAYVVSGGKDHIIWERDDGSDPDHITIETFHRNLSSQDIFFGGKTHPLSRVWMKSPNRRSYRGICFSPGKEAEGNRYNLWKGFKVPPLPKGERPSKQAAEGLAAFLEHSEENICRRDRSLHEWLMGYFAQMVQEPWKKPNVALVLRGGKGVGKNALIERVGELFGNHFLVASSPRYLTSSFNRHLENKVLLVLDEAFWSGDKSAEGTLKGIITAKDLVIEPKGCESYSVQNCLRIAILSNENWVVPASEDERRFAVFEVGDGRKQDVAFFQKMIRDMEAGGYALLHRYLLDYDISKINVHVAPKTTGLLAQKIRTFSGIRKWWHDNLCEGKIFNSDFADSWPYEISTESMRTAFQRYAAEKGEGRYLPTATQFGIELKKIAPSLAKAKSVGGGERTNTYRLPPLKVARQEFELAIGHLIEWETDIGDGDIFE